MLRFQFYAFKDLITIFLFILAYESTAAAVLINLNIYLASIELGSNFLRCCILRVLQKIYFWGATPLPPTGLVPPPLSPKVKRGGGGGTWPSLSCFFFDLPMKKVPLIKGGLSERSWKGGAEYYYSVDLTAATDRFPIGVISAVLYPPPGGSTNILCEGVGVHNEWIPFLLLKFAYYLLRGG